jgi:translation initiation factor 5A
MIQDHPCKIVAMTTSKTGKHGGAKVHLVGVDIFTDKKYEELCMSTANMMVPTVNRKDYQVIDIEDDGTVSYLDDNGESQSNLKLPDLCDSDKEVSAQLKKLWENPSDGMDLMITVLTAMGQDAIKACKEQKS